MEFEQQNFKLFFEVQQSVLQEIEAAEVVQTGNYITRLNQALKLMDYSVLDTNFQDKRTRSNNINKMIDVKQEIS
eukprot:CAMPEP_0116901702 /NCGR_PEP_ID=MMETSP0467-20121206/9532_1 /TAXON_ID=283647 /ORGANISM="Mesodinium pulex, Strain SPMC105" /LENGTH=74 /DNA_ID=CAMNT_0004575309 /DNA_START=256 /DNA_END=477 /DNA_ORIENTATION=-